MKKRYENGFFIAGLLVLAVMVSQLDFAQVWDGVSRAGYWFLAVVVLWFFLYMFNTAAWWLIIQCLCQDDTDMQKVPVSWLYKVTVSGFALNYATPGGLMGGEPYKIMSLAPKTGIKQATASVFLHTMTHIFSHFWFWLLSCGLYVVTQPTSPIMAVLLVGVTAFCLLAICFFQKGYRHGITVWCMTLLARFPMIRHKAAPFFERNAEKLAEIDLLMGKLHGRHPRTFACAVVLELLCRILSALEIFFILLVILPSANYLQCILILAFTSLFANMLFFIPLQLGGREGGFLMSVSGLGMSSSAGIFVALLVRLRELIWTGIGLFLIKMEKKDARIVEKT